VPELVLDNGLVRATFGRDDVGVPTGWQDVSITATSIVVGGTELAHNLNGVDPRDPDRQHSFYVDASGGKTRLVCSRVDVVRAEPGLVEVVFVDTTSTPLRHEHHLVMRAGRRGIYGYNIMTAVTDTVINEVRMNTRWDRSLLDHAYNWERGAGCGPAAHLRLPGHPAKPPGRDLARRRGQ
jgi:rhamnogalacturonan endolyase